MTLQNFANDMMIYEMKAKLIPLSREQGERG